MTPALRMSSEQRRQSVLRVARECFAEGGYEGTSTEDIARRADISQPYIFRLFGTKRDLFVAVVEDCYRRLVEAFEEAAGELSGAEALAAMGATYKELIQDPVTLLVQMHSFTASAKDAEIRQAAQAGMRRIWELAGIRSGLDEEALREWLAYGMLCNVVAALGLDQLTDSWACQLMPKLEDSDRPSRFLSQPV
jgi:AcrR family transcriptional regulator